MGQRVVMGLSLLLRVQRYKRYMRIFAMCALFLNVAGLMVGQSDPTTTGGFRNGRLWAILSDNSKAFYVAGIEDGEVIALFALPSAPKACSDAVTKLEPRGYVAGDYVKMLDEFYREPANVRVPIVYAYNYALKKLAGMSAKELSEMEATMRKFALDGK
jgi:hypothetical protein